MSSSLNEELLSVASTAARQNARNAEIFALRVGLDGGGGETLEVVGQRFDLTRERVRQIEVRCWRRLRTTHISTPYLDRAIDLIAAQCPIACTDVQNNLHTAEITKSDFCVSGLVKIASFMREKKEWLIVRHNSKSFVVLTLDFDLPSKASTIANKAISHWGMSTIDDIVARVNQVGGYSITAEKLAPLLDYRHDFHWLDKDSGWFWIDSTARNRLLNHIRKICCVCDSIHISELRSGVGRSHRMQGFAPPKAVLLEYCRQLPGFSVTGEKVAASPSLAMGDTLKGNELSLAKMMRDIGPVVRRDELETACRKEGFNTSSFYVYIGYSPFIVRYATGVYGLRGSSVPAGLVDRMKPNAPIRSQVQVDYGWTDRGDVWVVYCLNRTTITSGVVSIPGGMKDELQGDFILSAVDDESVGNLRGKDYSLWGLGSFFRQRGGEPGDYILLTFDLSNRVANVRIGTEELIETYT